MAALLAAATLSAALIATPARAQNAIVLENQLAGNPSTEWDIDGAGDLSIQGFATDISVNRGDTVHFKIKTDAAAYHIDVYRLGYYQGNGARHVGAGVVTATLPQTQPDDLYDPTTGTTDCGNWAESAHWDVPADAVSGVYLAKLTRDDTQGASHIVFIVRDDASHSDLLVQTSDATWEAYNVYGGHSLYVGGADGPPALNHASKVSYNRPFYTRNGGGGGDASEDWLFNSEYPMIRFLEANGYDVSYSSGVDTDRPGNLLLNHKVWIESGHDEYWSGAMRANVQAARDAGVNLAFFSGNEIYWKTRWEPSTDGSNTPYRTLVCYKEGTLGENVCGGKCDPLPGVWTGLWRDGCPPTYAPNDGCLPENALSGNISWDGTQGALEVSDAYKNLRFWRNTPVAALGTGQTATLGANTLGYEWDWQQYEASYPARRILLSSTNLDGKTHHLSLYRADSGALVFSAGTVQWSWGLDSNHDRGNDPPDPSIRQATVNLFADMNVQPGSLAPDLVNASPSSDALPPSSVIGFPPYGASLPSGTPVTITGTATDAGGGVVAGVEVSVDGGATWHAANGAATWSYLWTPTAQGTVTLESRGYDDTGNLEVPGGGEAPPNLDVVTVTAPAPPTCPCTVFQPTDTPAVASEDDPMPGELGMKFRSTVDGFVTGVRFYKGSQNTAPHLGHLWTSSGTMLAEVTFAGETATGWQEATFDAPVAITAGTTYVVSYHGPGFYSATSPFFTTAVANGPLRGLADGEDGPNGVYVYGAAAFPDQTYNQSNYWVDVVFNTSVGPDVTPPTVTALSPGNGATGIATTTAVTATFGEPLDAATVTDATVELRDPLSALVPATVSYNGPGRTATLAPISALAYSTTYTATLKGGDTDPRIKDVAGNALAADVTWSFTTGPTPPPPPTEGPGGPILVVSAAANPFSRYFAEILRNEGLNEFSAMDVSLVTPAVLAQYDVVVLGEQPLAAAQVTMFTDWTTAGGTLIAMRPDKQLAGFLGLTDANATLSDRYLLVNTASGPGVGIVNQTIQYHGAADLYTLNGATSLATLYSSATAATANPAVTTRSVGGNGGVAIAFTYDLARSVIYTRQGNPAWVNQKRDGQIPPIRSDDQFFGNASFDPQADWIDLNKVAIPQADEQQRLLANAILKGNLHRKPLPRFWYLPKGLKAAIVMTGDDHGDAGMQPRFDIYRSESTPGCSVDDWDCVRATGYEYVGSTFTDAQALLYHNMGFEVAVHVLTNCANFTQAEYRDFITTQFAQFHATFPSIPLPRTNRNHCIAWSDWSMTAETEVENGIRLDTNYYYWPAAWIQDRPGMFGGSGMPMRFAKLDGSMIDCYQAVTEMPDESGESFPQFSDALLDKAVGPEGYYGVFTTNMHFDQANHAGSNAVVASAQAHNVPVVSAEQMLDWLDGRNGSAFGGLSWSGNALSFTVTTGTGSRNIEGMLPTLAAVGALAGMTRNGSPVAYTTQTVKGIEYAFFPAAAGDYVAQYAVDTVPPAISAVTAVPHADGTATVSWTTDEASDSRVDYGTSAGSLNLNASASTLVTSHVVTLAALTPNTTYSYRVTSADAAANAATEPGPPAVPLSFTTPAALCATDRTAADFGSGALDANTTITEAADGEVTLKPAFDAEFSGATLPSEVTPATWTGGGTATVSGGALSVNGAHVSTNAAFGPGSSLQFSATFQADPFENIGFTADAAFDSPWITIGSGANGDGVYARANSASDVSLGSGLLGSSHRYRIDWTADSFVFYVDGASTPAATLPITLTANMVVNLSDFNLNGTALACDWLRVSPYATPGHFTSRVFDGGGPTNWGLAAWTAEVPAGTSLDVSFRSGNTATPDGTWAAFAPATNGASLGIAGRYVQYRADLATTAQGATPALDDVAVTCSAVADATPPVLSSVIATPGAGGTTATVTWATDEAATSRVDYGTSPGALTQDVAGASLVLAHSLGLTGLTPLTTYYYRVTSADGSNNSATSPASPAAPLSFTTAGPSCPADQSLADFNAGTFDANATTSQVADGEVILKPAFLTEFSGTSLPAGWTSDNTSPWTGGTAAVASGQLTVNGAHAASGAAFPPGSSMEFVATFQADGFENVGFSGDAGFNDPWITVGVPPAADGVYARTSTGAATLLSASLLGAPHRYRIDWGATTFSIYVDEATTPAATIALTVGTSMVAQVSDLTLNANALTLDWMRVTPYPGAGSFTSRVFDGAGATSWGTASWNADVPTGTSLAVSFRAGNTPVPDGTWSAFAPVAGGSPVGETARYLQYRADLATTAVGLTPALNDLAVACAPGTDTTPPMITNVVATPAGDGQSATVTWTTDESADSRVDFGTSAAFLGANASGATLVHAHSLLLSGLSPGSTYFYRVTSSDASSNAATSPASPAAPLSFTTPAPTCFTEQTTADFAAGTATGMYVSTSGDGELILSPALGAEFSGTSLPAGWTNVAWNGGGAATVSGGSVTVDGSRLTSPLATGYSAGSVLEFTATFGAAAFQNVGWGAGDDSQGSTGMFATGDKGWAMFGTAGTTTTLFTRLNQGGDFSLGSSFVGTSHRYRIEWHSSPDSVIFLVDGASVDRRPFTLLDTMRPGISDYSTGAPALLVDWLRVSPYAVAGSFVSAVHDGGGPTNWASASWTATVPAGTSVDLSVRAGNTAAPDGTWTGYQAVSAPGGSVGLCGRYVQYKADLATSVSSFTPVLDAVSLSCAPSAGPSAAVTNLAATGGTGNDTTGRLKIALSWSGGTAGTTNVVYRKSFGDYPLYRGTVGAAPATPTSPAAALAAGWAPTDVTASGQTDQPGTRDYWYYVLFQKDACGSSSPVSDCVAMPSYLLGDVSDGAAQCQGNNVVNAGDLSFLGAHYGATLSGPADPLACLDVGPTTDFSTHGRPQPDGSLDFEDLILMALNYTGGALPAMVTNPIGLTAGNATTAPAPASANALTVTVPALPDVGRTFDVVLAAAGTGNAHGLSVDLGFDPAVVEQLGVAPGALLAQQASASFALSPRAGRVDVALLGPAAALAGSGELARLTFRVRSAGDPHFVLRGVEARDGANQKIAFGAAAGDVTESLPARTELGAVYPNPFRSSLSLELKLSRPARVRLAVYDVAGRLMRSLLDSDQPAGRKTVLWDGSARTGLRAASGYYIVRFQAGGVVQTRPVWLVR